MQNGDAVTVVGSGAIGGIVAAHLAQAGIRVTIVDTNDAHRSAIRENGLRVSGATNVVAHPTVAAPDDPVDPVELALVAVKCHDTESALAFVTANLAEKGVAVSLQNGFTLYDFVEQLGIDAAIGAVVTLSGYLEAPGKVVHTNVGGLSLGRLDGRKTQQLRDVCRLLTHVCPTAPTGEIQRALWSKAALAAVWFATALVDADVVSILDDSRYRPVLGGLAAEVASTARLEGVECYAIDGFEPAAFLTAAGAQEESWRRHRDFWNSIGQTRTGVWRDLAVHRRRTEVGCIITPVLAFAKRHSHELPRLRRLLQLIEDVEEGSRELSWSNLDLLAETHTNAKAAPA